jgi:hypothetical protein
MGREAKIPNNSQAVLLNEKHLNPRIALRNWEVVLWILASRREEEAEAEPQGFMSQKYRDSVRNVHISLGRRRRRPLGRTQTLWRAHLRNLGTAILVSMTTGIGLLILETSHNSWRHLVGRIRITLSAILVEWNGALAILLRRRHSSIYRV